MSKPSITALAQRGTVNLLLVNALVLGLGIWLFISMKLMKVTGSGFGEFVVTAISVSMMGLGLWGLWLVKCRWNNFSKHPVAAALKAFGDPEKIVPAIDKNLESVISVNGLKAIFTNDWILAPTIFGCDVYKVDDLVWAYELKIPKIKMHRIVILYKLVFVMRFADRRDREFDANKKGARSITSLLDKRAPWAVLGYDKKLEKHWPHEFIHGVMIKKAELGFVTEPQESSSAANDDFEKFAAELERQGTEGLGK